MRRAPRPAAEAGSSTTELVLLMPVVLLLVMLIVQFGLWFHARQVATAAAQEGLAVTQAEHGTRGTGRQRALAFVTEAGGLREIVVRAHRDQQTASVHVHGVVPAVVPELSLQVQGVATGRVERFLSEVQR